MSRTHLLPNAGSALDLHQAIYCAAREYRGGLTALAAMMAMPYNTLQKKISIAEPGHRLSLPEFEELADILNDPRIDDAYARSRGMVVFKPVPAACNSSALQSLSKMLVGQGDFVRTLDEAMEDGLWHKHEVEALEQHGMEVIQQLLGIMAGARNAMVED